MSSRKVMTELTPMLPAALASSGGEDEESLWGSDWDSDWLWESDWESDCEKKPAAAKEQIEDYDSENEVLRVKSMKGLASEDRYSSGRGISPTKGRRTVMRPGDEAGDECDDDGEEEDDDGDDTDSEESAAPGSACHFCKMRKAEPKVQCSRCPIEFCGSCLQNRHGEQLEVEAQGGVKWVCPKCRAGCGPGCNNCCTCASCRKIQGLAPAGQVIRIARQLGFDNVHDYLIHHETGESREKIAKRKKGTGWTKAGGAVSSSSTGVNASKLKPAQHWKTDDFVPANHGGVELWNQKKGLAWTIPKAMGEIMKSTINNAEPGDGTPVGTTVPFGDIRKPGNGMKALKFIDDQHKKVLDYVLGRERGRESLEEHQKPERMKLSLERIVNRLLHPEDESGQDRLGNQLGRFQQIRRNRKHRKLGRILEPSMFRNRKSKTDNATKTSQLASEFPPTVRMDDAHIDQCSKEPTATRQESNPSPDMQSVPYGQRDQPSFGTSIILKRPITSLQTLRKMGILAKRNHASVASEESVPQQGPAIAPSPLPDHSNQSLKQNSEVVVTSPPVPPSISSESGSQAILLRHLEKRKKIEFRPCSKSQTAVSAEPASCNLVKESIIWRGGLKPRQSEPHSGFGQFSEKRPLTGFERSLPMQSGTQSGFELFSHNDTLIGFGSVNGEEQARLSALRTCK